MQLDQVTGVTPARWKEKRLEILIPAILNSRLQIMPPKGSCTTAYCIKHEMLIKMPGLKICSMQNTVHAHVLSASSLEWGLKGCREEGLCSCSQGGTRSDSLEVEMHTT